MFILTPENLKTNHFVNTKFQYFEEATRTTETTRLPFCKQPLIKMLAWLPLQKLCFYMQILGGEKKFREVPVRNFQAAAEGLQIFRACFGLFFGFFFAFFEPFSHRFRCFSGAVSLCGRAAPTQQPLSTIRRKETIHGPFP